MFRRIVVMRSRPDLTPRFAEAFKNRSLRDVEGTLETHALVAGMSFVPGGYPLPAYRAASSAAPRRGLRYGGSEAPSVVHDGRYIVSAEFDDEDAVSRLLSEKGNGVIGVFANPEIDVAPPVTCEHGPIGGLEDVRAALRVEALEKAGLTGKDVRIAIVDSGINGATNGPAGAPLAGSLGVRGWALDPAYVPGSAPIDHGTMVAYDALIAAPDATLLDYALFPRSAGVQPLKTFLDHAHAAFVDLIDLLEREPGALVVNNSWAMYTRSGDVDIKRPENYRANPAHPFNAITGALVAAGADVLFAAGNCGSGCPFSACGLLDIGRGNSIHGANSHPSVITVAAATVNHTRVRSSSQGPGGLSAKKPDIGSFSEFAGSGVYSMDGGTSAASPTAAGVIAALRQLDSDSPPAVLKGVLQSTASFAGAKWDEDLGYGILDVGKALSTLQERVVNVAVPPQTPDVGSENM